MRLIYLDTSFISELCGLDYEQQGEQTDKILWGKLLDNLIAGVKKGHFLCPISQFVLQELSLRPDILDKFANIRNDLSRGCYFRDWQKILVHQAVNQILIYLNRSTDIDLNWRPYCQEFPPVIKPRSTINSKSEILQYANDHKETPKPNTFEEQYKQDRQLYLRETFFLPWHVFKGYHTMTKPKGTLDEIFMESEMGKLMIEACISADRLPEIMNYFASDEGDSIPYIRIHSALYAQLRLKHKYEEGDWLDIEAMSSAIPYCSIITTDRRMKSVINEQKALISGNNSLNIYSPRVEDVDLFLKELQTNYL